MKPLLVGEANPYGSDPRYALYPYPENSAGGRLCHKVMGLTLREYVARFDRVNLCPSDWRMSDARRTAERLKASCGARVVVLFGAKVCAAFDVRFEPFAQFGAIDVAKAGRTHPLSAQDWLPSYVVLPHPSGRNRAWNEPGAYERARAVLRDAEVLS